MGMGVCLLGMFVVQVGNSRADLSARGPLLSVCVCVSLSVIKCNTKPLHLN
jgi:hypothetical protein